ncbi:hypothetical protein ACF3OB_10295 [Capnocytophaga canis]|uniref:hypothetical protein n=1 Tax=Capnocytophaga TaxID=1016 RepID=UPI000BB1D11C|nr:MULTISPECIES: hypothetical protein [Capnocytophaga]ATA72172.1 hypothetical protein CGC49_01910 [Capnocytophaga sp. H4358]ATA74292.1 hypothetical protein CGC52_01860 [Capnocytophaga sp. H2931]GIM61781.1 hypothetical protein CAPN008_18310 [Capnocytophaga canis]
MFRKDYIKRQIDLFFQELANLLSKKVPKEEKLKELANMSERFTGNLLVHLQERSAEELVNTFENDLDTIEIISELLYHSEEENTKNNLLKVKSLLFYINQKSAAFSLNRDQKMQEIERKLKEL